jgi:hypothetical protein
MIDTGAMELGFRTGLTPAFASKFNWRPIYDWHTGEGRGYVHVGKKGTYLPRLSFLQRANGLWYLRTEVCFPKWLYGSNVTTLPESELPFALDKLSRYVEEISDKPFRAEHASLSRIDFVEDTIVPEHEIYRLFRKFYLLEHPKFRRRTYDKTTAYFEPRSKCQYIQVKIYSKYHELIRSKPSPQELELARGRVRLEITLRTKAINKVKEELGLLSRETAGFLKSAAGIYVLEREKAKINYNEQFREDDNDMIQRALENVDDPSRLLTIGFLEAYKRLGPKFYELPKSPCQKRSYQSLLSKARKMGFLP